MTCENQTLECAYHPPLNVDSCITKTGELYISRQFCLTVILKPRKCVDSSKLYIVEVSYFHSVRNVSKTFGGHFNWT